MSVPAPRVIAQQMHLLRAMTKQLERAYADRHEQAFGARSRGMGAATTSARDSRPTENTALEERTMRETLARHASRIDQLVNETAAVLGRLDGTSAPRPKVKTCRNCHLRLPTFAKGLCSTCYRYQYRTGLPRPAQLDRR